MRNPRQTCAVLLQLGLLYGCGGAQPRAASDDHGSVGTTADDDGGTGETDPSGAYGPEQRYELRLSDDAPPPLMLEMDRDEVAELFGDAADDILLLELDSAPLLTAALENIKTACGTAWQLDDPDPKHDCSLTPLGQSFEGYDGTWRTSPEYALVRVLTMTPANLEVSGTSSEKLAALADAMGVGGGYGQILADALQIARTDPVVPTESLVVAFQEGFLESHPEIGEGAKLRFMLADALSDLATMTERYGPAGSHPGVIDPSFTVHGKVFGPDFRMIAVAESNLRLVDGIDAELGKGFMSIVADSKGPTYDDELEFDFEDPESFRLEGVVEDLRADLRFRVIESDDFVWSCLGNPPCHENVPGHPVSTASVWARDPWLLEYAMAAGAYDRYKLRVFHGIYLFGAAHVYIGMFGDPPGWIVYDIPFDIGDPPEDQYLWETILEVAQVALHRTPYQTFAEGQANVAFTLHDVPVGLTGTEAADAVRPYLQQQASKLADVLLGDYKKNNDRLDFYYRRGENGEPYFFFIAPDDLPDGEPYGYARPGFYGGDDLKGTSKVSRTAVPGLVDTVHEKVAIPEGETTLYYEDENGEVYRLRVERHAGGTALDVHVARRLQ